MERQNTRLFLRPSCVFTNHVQDMEYLVERSLSDVLKPGCSGAFSLECKVGRSVLAQQFFLPSHVFRSINRIISHLIIPFLIPVVVIILYTGRGGCGHRG